jgi:prepilin-type N-terminal cleavage/methylation domain-containing protein
MNCIKETELLVAFNRNKNKNGFSLIELIVVMLLLAALALTVLPRFISFQDDAEKATVLATAISFKDALKLIRVKWILAGKPNSSPYGISSISYGGAEIKLRKGYPYSVNNIDDDKKAFENDFSGVQFFHATTNRCDALFNTLLTDPPDNTYLNDTDVLRNNTFYVFYYDAGSSDDTSYMGTANGCIYYLVSRLDIDINESSFDNLSLAGNNPDLSGFVYDPNTGRVVTFFDGLN